MERIIKERRRKRLNRVLARGVNIVVDSTGEIRRPAGNMQLPRAVQVRILCT